MDDQYLKLVYVEQYLYDKLALIAQQKYITPSDLMDQILTDYFVNKNNKIQNHEKRRFKRKNVFIPAMIYESIEDKNIGRYFSSTLIDISFGGISLGIPPEKIDKMEFIKSNSMFEVLFYCSEKGLARFQCTPRHVIDEEDTVKVGSSFVGAVMHSPAELRMLMQ